MPEFIRGRELVEKTSYELFYSYADYNGTWGFGFPCDEDGNVDMEDVSSRPQALINYNGCLKGEVNGHKMAPPVIKTIYSSFRRPAAIICNCGLEVDLWDPMTNECPCGRMYNGSGQTLAPMQCWGKETGEHPSDIANWRNYREDY